MFTKDKPEGKGEKPQGTQSSDVHLSAVACKKNNKKNCWSFKVMFWSSFSSVVVWLCAAYANIVLFLCSLSRQSYTDLVEPLITAAITLDPVYLKSNKLQRKIVFLMFLRCSCCIITFKFVFYSYWSSTFLNTDLRCPQLQRNQLQPHISI